MAQTRRGRRRQHQRAGGFTLVELLIVILIIAVLVSILIPTVSKVRQAAWVANTKNQVSQITGAIERYYGEQHQYPGPLDDSYLQTQERGLGTPQLFDATVDSSGNTPLDRRDHVTQAENLVLGLFGGLKWISVGPAYHLCFDSSMLGRGMMSMNPAVPKRFAPYLDDLKMLSAYNQPPPKVWITNLHYYDDAAPFFNGAPGRGADDSSIPEIVDKFPNSMPILYLRAHPGTQGVVRYNRPDSAVPTRTQYDLSDVYPYTRVNQNGQSIGEGKKIRISDYTSNFTPAPTAGNLPHGLQDVHAPSNKPMTIIKGDPPTKTYVYPYDAWPYLRDPGTPYILTGNAAADDAANTPRAKDRFMLIGAGLDRVYGTADDICSFGDVLQQ